MVFFNGLKYMKNKCFNKLIVIQNIWQQHFYDLFDQNIFLFLKCFQAAFK